MNLFFHHRIVAVATISAAFFFAAPVFAKVLLLSHFNDSFNHVQAAETAPLHGSTENTGIGAGYSYTDSMPAVGGLNLRTGGFIGYRTSGNLLPEEGTIMFRFKLSHPYIKGPKTEYIFTLGAGPRTVDCWKNTIVISWGGWNNRLNCSIIDQEGKATGTAADTSFWQPDTNWHQIVFSWSRSNRRITLYIDGRLIDRKDNVTAFPSQFPPYMFLGTLNGWHEWGPHQYDELLILDRECDELEAAAAYERKTEFPATYDFKPSTLIQPIPLGDAAVTSFADDRAADRKGGWTDQGPDTDRHDLKPGNVTLQGMPFVIGDRCIVLANSERDYFPKIKTISIGGRWEELLFVQCGAWVMTPGKTCGYYDVHYVDGTVVSIPLVTLDNIGDWSEPVDIERARTVLPGTGGFRKKSGAFLFAWKNPHPNKEIASITFRSAMDEAMPILIALSGVKPGSGLSHALDLMTRIRKNEVGKFNELGKTYQSELARIPKLRKTLEQLQPTTEQRKSFYGREAQRLHEEAIIYMREIERNREYFEKAITGKKYDATINLEKHVGYLGYLSPLIERIRSNLARTKKTHLMTPTIPATLPQSAISAPATERWEIIMNGPWETCGGTPDFCNDKWSPVIVPNVFHDKLQQRWLRRKVVIPPGMSNRKLRLFFECSPYITEVYVNRKFVGRHIGLEPFALDVTNAAASGRENEIMVFVAGKTCLFNGNDNGFSYPSSHTWNYGILQDVVLQCMPQVSIDHPYVYLDQDNQLHFRGKIAGAADSAGYTLEVTLGRSDRQETFGPFPVTLDQNNTFEMKTPWAKPLLWGIGGKYGAPNLFHATYTLRHGQQTVDKHTFRTGFAQFTIEQRLSFALNGKRLFLQGDHYWTSEGHEGATSRAFMMRYFRLLRAANFNITRDHHLGSGNIYNAALDVADELGFLLEPEAANSGTPTLVRSRNYTDPVFRHNLENYRRGMALKLRTHPSVVLYSGSNEIFQTVDPLIDQSAEVFADLEKVFHEVAPHIQLTEQGSNWRKEFPTVDVHYSLGKAFADWNRLGDKPAIHGEYNFMQGYYFDMQNPNPVVAAKGMQATAKAFRQRIAYEKSNGLAGTMPFQPFI